MRALAVACLMGLFCVAGLYSGPAQATGGISSHTLKLLQKNPGLVLRRYPHGGSAMVDFLAQAVRSNSRLVGGFMGLTGNANKRQRAALGAGPARAAKYFTTLSYNSPNRSTRLAALSKANYIANMVSHSRNNTILVSFAHGAGRSASSFGSHNKWDYKPSRHTSKSGHRKNAFYGGGAYRGHKYFTYNARYYLHRGRGHSYHGHGCKFRHHKHHNRRWRHGWHKWHHRRCKPVSRWY